MYKNRMLSYYPQAVKSILEFQGIVEGEHPEFKRLSEGVSTTIADAYLLTMSETRVAQWEKQLGIQPVAGATLSDRRDVIIARIRGQGKLNTALIKRIVHAFTGTSANIYLIDSELVVEFTQPKKDFFNFKNLRQELLQKIPAHLCLTTVVNGLAWRAVNDEHPNWEDVLTRHETWNDVKFGWHITEGLLDVTPIDDFVLA